MTEAIAIVSVMIGITGILAYLYNCQPEEQGEGEGNPLRKVLFLLTFLFLDLTTWVAYFISFKSTTYTYLKEGLLAMAIAIGLLFFAFVYWIGMGILEDIAIARQKKAQGNDFK